MFGAEMTNPRVPTVVHAFTAMISVDPTRPLMTFYDDGTGERVELSGATLANWVAKTANLLVDGVGLGPGQVAVVRLPPHWQTAAILLGCWLAGLTVDLDRGSGADVGFVTTSDEPMPADETFALSLAPLGQPFRSGPPPGTQDFTIDVRRYGDELPRIAAAPGLTALSDGTTHAELVAAGAAAAVPASSRVLIDADAAPDPRTWLVAPLVAGASVVLCRNLDQALLAERLASERAQLHPPSTGD
jgi:uncharacterized protein (TIGR03089 family)